MKTEEQPLWRIACNAFREQHTEILDDRWVRSTDAVIAEHERRELEKSKADLKGLIHEFVNQPEPFAAEKAALATGKMIQYYSKSSLEWLDCDPCPPSWEPTYEYRVKPDPVPYAAESSGQIVDLVESILRILKSQQP